MAVPGAPEEGCGPGPGKLMEAEVLGGRGATECSFYMGGDGGLCGRKTILAGRRQLIGGACAGSWDASQEVATEGVNRVMQ